MPDLKNVIDMMGREVEFHFPPKRVVSLVPSQTEFLVDIGAPVVGRTKFCIHPSEKVAEIPVIGGTKNFRFDAIDRLKPDLIIGNKEENYVEGIKQLESRYPVWMSDIYTLDDAYTMMQRIGQLVSLEKVSKGMVTKCKKATDKVKGSRSGKALYLIWHNPWMAAGRNTFIDHMLSYLGYENVVKEDRYPMLTDQSIADLNPDYLLFSSEPYPFRQSHLEAAKSKWPKVHSELVDGELYSWYGSRLRNWS